MSSKGSPREKGTAQPLSGMDAGSADGLGKSRPFRIDRMHLFALR